LITVQRVNGEILLQRTIRLAGGIHFEHEQLTSCDVCSVVKEAGMNGYWWLVCVCVCVCEGRIHTPKDCHILDLNPCILLFSVVMSGCKQLVAQSCWAAKVTKAQALLKFILEGVKTFFYSVQNSGSYSTWVFDSCCSYLTAAHHLTGHSVASFFALTPTQLLSLYFRVLQFGCGLLYHMLNAPLFLYRQPIPLSNTLSEL